MDPGRDGYGRKKTQGDPTSDCSRRDRPSNEKRQTEGQINRHPDSAKGQQTEADSALDRQMDKHKQGDRRLVRQDGSSIHLLPDSSRSVCSVSWSVFKTYTLYTLTELSLCLPTVSICLAPPCLNTFLLHVFHTLTFLRSMFFFFFNQPIHPLPRCRLRSTPPLTFLSPFRGLPSQVCSLCPTTSGTTA